MIRFSVRRVARFVSRHPNWCLIAATLFTILSVFLIQLRLEIKMDMAALLPEDSQVNQTYQIAQHDFGSFDFMLGVVEADSPGQEELLKDAADKLASALNDRDFVRSVTARFDPEDLEFDSPEEYARAIALLTNDDWRMIESQLSPDAIDAEIAALAARQNAPVGSAITDRRFADPLRVYEILLERIKFKSGPLKVSLADRYFMSEDGQMLLVLVWPVNPATDLGFAQELRKFLEATHEGINIRNPEYEENGVTISFFGPHYEAIADSELVANDFLRTSVMSFIAVIFLFFVAFRRPEALLFVSLPLILGVTWTLGLTSLFIGRLTQVTIVFGAILIGLGIDFSVHLYNRYLEEIRRGTENREALRLAVEETGPGIIAGALTTAIAFFGMTITSFVGFRELGLVSGIGVMCCLVAVMIVLPPLLAYFGSGPVGVFTQRPMSTFGLKRFHYLATAFPRMTVFASLVVCSYLGFQAQNVEFDDDFRSLRQPSQEYRALQERIVERFDVPSNQLVAIVSGETLPEALEENDALFRRIYAAVLSDFNIIAIDSLRYFLPSPETQRLSLEKMSSAQLNIESVQRQIFAAADKYGISHDRFSDFLSRLGELQGAADQALETTVMPLDASHLSKREYQIFYDVAIRYLYNASDSQEDIERPWRIVTWIYPPSSESERDWITTVPEAFKTSLLGATSNPPEITGSVVIQEEMRRIIVRDLAITVLVVLFAVAAYLLLHFGNIWHALLATLPVIMALMCMLGTIHLLDMKLHYLNIIALPMVVGIGVDSGIHLLQRFLEGGKQDMVATVQRTGRAVIITAFTTMFGFGSLALANFRGIRELGLLSIIGVAFTLVTALLVLPAVLMITSDRTARYRGGEGDDLG